MERFTSGGGRAPPGEEAGRGTGGREGTRAACTVGAVKSASGNRRWLGGWKIILRKKSNKSWCRVVHRVCCLLLHKHTNSYLLTWLAERTLLLLHCSLRRCSCVDACIVADFALPIPTCFKRLDPASAIQYSPPPTLLPVPLTLLDCIDRNCAPTRSAWCTRASTRGNLLGQEYERIWCSSRPLRFRPRRR